MKIKITTNPHKALTARVIEDRNNQFPSFQIGQFIAHGTGLRDLRDKLSALMERGAILFIDDTGKKITFEDIQNMIHSRMDMMFPENRNKVN